MFFNSMKYLLFLPAVVTVYYLLPHKIRKVWLLAASYYFYMKWNAKYGALLFAVTAITWVCAGMIAAFGKKGLAKQRKAVLAACISMNFGLLCYFKYLSFFLENFNKVISHIGEGMIPIPDILLPVGISFFIFQAVGYVVDVYRNDVEAEKDFILYALFVSFFPQLVAGPIERSGNLLHQLKAKAELDGENLEVGLCYILFGVWQKVFVADNIAHVIDPVIADYGSYPGYQVALAMMLFAVQILCDFGGYSNIAMGSARLLGIRLMQNFNAPYMAASVSEFWHRWHISLTSWFRDYLYIPLGGNRKGKKRKYLNQLLVFCASGLWHGAGWNYLVWGAANGLMVAGESMLGRKQPGEGLSAPRTWARRIITFFLKKEP